MDHERPTHTLSPDQALAAVGGARAGLSSAEAARRLAEHGPNELAHGEEISRWWILAAQFKSLVVWILIGAAALSIVIGDWTDGVAILAIVVLNALIGFRQEAGAEHALAALKKMTAPRARVRRDGSSRVIAAAEVVTGDLLELEAGDLVPADARLLEVSSLACIESALTGESEAVEKQMAAVPAPDAPLGDRVDLVFLGTSVAAGKGSAVVVATGMATEMGRIATLLEQVEGDASTPLQRRLAALGRMLVYAALGLVLLLFVIGLVRGLPFVELLLTSVGLAVAAVPEGLPTVVTIALAVGVQRMASRRALVRRLHAVETLGQANVICSDKTGTLTVGAMTVRELWALSASWRVEGEGYAPDGRIVPADPARADQATLAELLTVFAGCNGAALRRENDAWTVVGDPTEGALLAAAAKGGVTSESIECDFPRTSELPFDSARKRMTIVRRAGAGRRALVKGAPDVLLERCAFVMDPGSAGGIRPVTDEDRRRIQEAQHAMSARALRVLAAAWRNLGADEAVTDPEQVERDLVFAGLAGMYDPPRPEAKEAVAKARSAGIHVAMITGDHPQTALAVARELGLADVDAVALSGPQIEKASDDELARLVPRTTVFARVSPEHKLRIVRAYKKSGAVVAMTGDGVNDAPAIRGADIGLAMGVTGTEVAKEAADMVITDDNFASIVAAIEEGRGIYANIRKTLQYLLAGNCGELMFMTACIASGLPLPLTPVQLLWINLVTDGLPALCLATDPIDRDVMRARPRARDAELTDRGFVRVMALTGFLTAAVAFAVYVAALRVESEAMARGHAFTVLVVAELMRSFGARSDTRAAWQVGFTTNLRLFLVVSISLALQLAAPHVGIFEAFLQLPDMPFHHCLWLFAAGCVPLVVLEALKAVRRRRAGGAS